MNGWRRAEEEEGQDDEENDSSMFVFSSNERSSLESRPQNTCQAVDSLFHLGMVATPFANSSRFPAKDDDDHDH